MAGRALVTVNGIDLPEPSKYKGNTATLVDAGRNVEGKMIGSVVRDDVAKVELVWNYLTVEQWAEVLSLFTISAGGSFINRVTFFDQTTGTWVEREMYVSDRNADAWKRNPRDGSLEGWLNCTLSLIEV
jgi:hypothetical protein